MVRSRGPFDIAFSELPEQLPIFPLPGAIVLPGQVLPLNIFEPRYLNMVLDALGGGRLIGMIQPLTGMTDEPVAVHPVGCAGRISAFQETPDSRLLINLTGVCRFRIQRELDLVCGYRRIRPGWQEFARDVEGAQQTALRFDELEPALRAYFSVKQLEPKWEALRSFEPAGLVDFLSVTLPFDVITKQSLVEAIDADTRGKLMLAALGEALLSEGGSGQAH